MIEVGVPELQRLPPGETLRAFRLERHAAGASTSSTSRTKDSSPITSTLVDGRAERNSVPFRYVWPAELDLMAELAGMRLRDRWSGWQREPFTSESRQHVSVWERPR